jgi:hypothetical protein
MEEEDQERIDLWKETRRQLESILEGETNEEQREVLRFRIDCCRSLIKQIYGKDNPTNEKGMYK